MELNLAGKWELYLPPDDAENGDFSSVFPHTDKSIEIPSFAFARPFEGKPSAWIRREFSFHREKEGYVYLTFFFTEAGEVFLNGERVGALSRTAKKQTFDVTKLLKEQNSLVVHFTGLNEHSTCFPKSVFVIENSTAPALSRKRLPPSPRWIAESVIYSVYVRNFSAAGTFAAVEAELPRIRDLGVNVLWFLPIHPIGRKNRKGSLGCPYSISDYMSVNPEYGTLEDFKRLVARAHELGMKVIIDLVINHTSFDSVLMDNDPAHFKPVHQQVAAAWGWDDVVDLDYSNPKTREAILDMMLYWVRECDIDGYRCDVAFLVPHDFWKESISAVRAIKPEILMLAESDDPLLYFDGFDLTYDWGLLYLLEGVDRGDFPLSDVGNYVQAQYDYFPAGHNRLLFIENHDTERAMSVFHPENVGVFQSLITVLPGVPLIYNGLEIGAKKRPDLFERDPINWETVSYGLTRAFYVLKNVRLSPALHQAGQDSFDFMTPSGFFQIRRRANDSTLDAVFELYRLGVKIYGNEVLLGEIFSES